MHRPLWELAELLRDELNVAEIEIPVLTSSGGTVSWVWDGKEGRLYVGGVTAGSPGGRASDIVETVVLNALTNLGRKP